MCHIYWSKPQKKFFFPYISSVLVVAYFIFERLSRRKKMNRKTDVVLLQRYLQQFQLVIFTYRLRIVFFLHRSVVVVVVVVLIFSSVFKNDLFVTYRQNFCYYFLVNVYFVFEKRLLSIKKKKCTKSYLALAFCFVSSFFFCKFLQQKF